MSMGDPFGMHVWFDPSCEAVELRALTAEEKSVRLDIHGSVSALETEIVRLESSDQMSLLPEEGPHGS